MLRRACFRKKNNFLPYCSFVNKVKGTHLNTSKLRKKLYVIKNAKNIENSVDDTYFFYNSPVVRAVVQKMDNPVF